MHNKRRCCPAAPKNSGGSTLPFQKQPSRRSLLIAPSTITEAVLAQPLLALLRRFDAFGRIDVLAEPGIAPIFRAMSEPDEVLESDIPIDRIAPLRRLALSRTIDAHAYDRAFILQDSRTAAIAPWLARVPNRIGFGSTTFLGMINRPAASGGGRGKSIAERFVAMAFEPGESLPPGIPTPQLAAPPEMTPALARQLSLDPASQLVLLCPSSELGPSSEWPVRHYAELAALIRLQWPEVTVGLVGRPRDRSVATQIALLCGESLQNWCGRLDLHQTLALVNHAAAVVTSESQYMHLAAALGRPHVAIYGSG
ncbi:MAG TPA: lipopolysaccharide heptosyltransferase II, partial [Reyranella sp.]|nr:lipopolysaccharide heptosyltransferase II [Reyranella sp.]